MCRRAGAKPAGRCGLRRLVHEEAGPYKRPRRSALGIAGESDNRYGVKLRRHHSRHRDHCRHHSALAGSVARHLGSASRPSASSGTGDSDTGAAACSDLAESRARRKPGTGTLLLLAAERPSQFQP